MERIEIVPERIGPFEDDDLYIRLSVSFGVFDQDDELTRPLKTWPSLLSRTGLFCTTRVTPSFARGTVQQQRSFFLR